MTLRELARLDDAKINLRHALQIAPNDAVTISVMGDVLYRRARFDEAMEWYDHRAAPTRHAWPAGDGLRDAAPEGGQIQTRSSPIRRIRRI